MFLLDTNLVAELRKVRCGKANAGVAAWADQVETTALFISAITLHELVPGVLLMERRDPAQGALLRQWLDQAVLPAFAGRILAVDSAVAQRSAALPVPEPLPFRGGLIAATVSLQAAATTPPPAQTSPVAH